MAFSKFRSRVWDPSLIICQIIAMQFEFYSTLLLCNYLMNKMLNMFLNEPQVYSLSDIFDFRLINFHGAKNAFACITLIISSLISALFQWKLINRSKQCLDFTVTLFVYHIIFSWFYVGEFPNTFMFWITIVICGILKTLLSEYLCMQSALKEIPLSFAPKANL